MVVSAQEIECERDLLHSNIVGCKDVNASYYQDGRYIRTNKSLVFECQKIQGLKKSLYLNSGRSAPVHQI